MNVKRPEELVPLTYSDPVSACLVYQSFVGACDECINKNKIASFYFFWTPCIVALSITIRVADVYANRREILFAVDLENVFIFIKSRNTIAVCDFLMAPDIICEISNPRFKIRHLRLPPFLPRAALPPAASSRDSVYES
jgi:hypothetical protein